MAEPTDKDLLQIDIVYGLLQLGVVVCILNQEGVPDLLTFWQGRWLPLQITTDSRALTQAQTELYQAAPFPVVRSLEDALSLFRVKP
jgi:hypothetical protein